jgi:hypothetical protein
MKSENAFDIIPSGIVKYWRGKYGPYLTAYRTEDLIIFVENGTLDSFHPSGDRLARHDKKSGKTLYIWNNNVNDPLTESQYMNKLLESLLEQY